MRFFRLIRRVVVIALLVVLAVPWVVGLAGRVLPVPYTPLMAIRLTEGHGLERDWEPLERISPHLAEAVIAAEDNHFCSHHGVDWAAVGEAVEEFRSGERLRGASTITMQTAKNVMLWPGRNPVRKLLEAYAAVVLDLVWPKHRILEVYLNIAEWAPGVYGAQAAAAHHFGKPAEALSRREAALLAAVLPNPLGWPANPPSGYISDRARSIEQGIGRLGPMLDCASRPD